jgi:hypothetical protein
MPEDQSPKIPLIDSDKLKDVFQMAKKRYEYDEEIDRRGAEAIALRQQLHAQAAQHERELGLVLHARICTLTNPLRLMFCKGGHDVNCQLVRLRPETKCTFLASRSSLAITSVAPCLRQASCAARNCGRFASASAPLPVSTS